MAKFFTASCPGTRLLSSEPWLFERTKFIRHSGADTIIESAIGQISLKPSSFSVAPSCAGSLVTFRIHFMQSLEVAPLGYKTLSERLGTKDSCRGWPHRFTTCFQSGLAAHCWANLTTHFHSYMCPHFLACSPPETPLPSSSGSFSSSHVLNRQSCFLNHFFIAFLLSTVAWAALWFKVGAGSTTPPSGVESSKPLKSL